MKTDFDRDTEPINYPKQDQRALVVAGLGLLLASCVLLGALLALINMATGGQGL